ncbi:major facilitator superfamily domain-containing protein 6 [Fopius arisanus]|uniref:Major facilitator superfamily domain-containing protein 6 n=1 Tax=Fopius arisanus TaxID=64838 RepID=A0A9R1U9R7_9HYME|nr:PREDICTED: major facilitator superfamily domain-containing protein 6 [Fopius arisanus]XP_011314217.1 PREDICTED: major facilitator superfamily domain-containing protein 6 [Fopius arisanus]
MFGNVNKDLVPIKAHYFLYNAATGPIVPFLPTIAKQLGFSGFLVGSIYTILPISGLIAKPLFGGLADRFRLHKIFFLLFQAILAIAFFSIYFIPPVELKTQSVQADVILKCDNAAVFLEVCSSTGFTNETLNNVIDHGDPKTKCRLSCESSEKLYKELCNLNVTEYCPKVDHPDVLKERINFTAMFNMNRNVDLMRCVDIRLRNATFSLKEHYNVSKLYCNNLVRTSCVASCPGVTVMEALLREAHAASSRVDEDTGDQTTYQFHLFLWAAIISWVGMAVVVSIADAICFDLLGDERRKEYGKQKMWGSIGFGIFGISAGYLVDVFSRGQGVKDYTCIFYIMLIAMIFDMIVSATLKKKTVEYTDHDPSVLWELGSVAREGRVLVFAFWCIGAGMCTGVVWNFLFWYTEDIVKNDTEWLKTIQGLITGVQCFLGELPFNFISGRVLKKLGHINVMSLVLLFYAVRFMAYSLVRNVWAFLIIEILHGPTLGLCWPTMVSYGEKVAPSGTRATMQGFVGAVFEGLGVSSGSLICGWLISSYGGIVTFRVFSIGALVWLTIYWILQLLLQKAKAYPLHQGHSHLASYAAPNDAILMTMSQELQTY